MDRVSAHPLIEFASFYALGALTQLEARAFEEHVAEGCDVCFAELESFEQTVNALGFSEPEAEPPVSARTQLLTRLSEIETRLEGRIA